MPEVKDIENDQLNVLEIIIEHCVDEYLVDDTLCRIEVDLTVTPHPTDLLAFLADAVRLKHL